MPQFRQIEGKNPVLEALRAGSKIHQIFLEDNIDRDDKINQILVLARKKGIGILKKGWKNINRMSRSQSHQGVIAVGEDLEFANLGQILNNLDKAKRDPFILVLPHVLYDYNLGAVIRTAEAAGVDCIVLGRQVKLGPGVGRASMGAVEYMPLVSQNIFSALEMLSKKGVKIVSASENAQQNYYEADLTGPLALVIGAEDKGISSTVGRRIKYQVKIPMMGKIESLNLSVAAAILVYESLKQKLVKTIA